MGLSITVTDYTGKEFERIDDAKNVLHRLLPPADEDSFSLLAKIDWYGDTYFNYLQLKQFLNEWEHMMQSAQQPEEHELSKEVIRMARRCHENRSLLRFIGD